jgi:hypothetical protein
MTMKIRLASLLAALWLSIAPALAANQAPYQTPTTGPMSASTFTATYLNPALLAIGTCNWGPTAPANGPGAAASTYQAWCDTSASPVVTIKIYDGAQWVAIGTLNTSTHAFAAVVDGTAWTAYTPTLQAGSFGTATYTATGRYKIFGKTIIVQSSVTVTAVGTATGAMQIVLPFASSNLANYSGSCYESGVSGKSGAGITQVGSSNRMYTTDATGATWFATGKVVDCTITYEMP